MPATDISRSYSKGDVNRAARLWVNFMDEWRQASGDERTKLMDKFDVPTLLEADDAMAWWRRLHAGPLARVNANLRYYVRDCTTPVAVTQRLKRQPTIIDKLKREPKMNLTQMGDIGGVRAIVGTRDEIYAIGKRLRKNWDVERTRDYMASPKPSGYRAVHHIVRRGGCRIEVQLRTPRQDEWANGVEDDSRRVGVGLKSGFGPEKVHEYYVAVAAFFEMEELGKPVEEEFRQRLVALYDDAEPYLKS